MTTASKITMLRIGMIPIFMLFMYLDFPYSDIIALMVFIIAGITDSVDGYVARKFNQISTFGKFIDPLADKLLVFAAMLILVERGQVPSWAAIIIITREFAVTALRLVAVEAGVVIAAGTSGKIKTVVSIVGICIMLTDLAGFVIIPPAFTTNSLCVLLMLATTVWSGVEYFYKNKDVLDIGS